MQAALTSPSGRRTAFARVAVHAVPPALAAVLGAAALSGCGGPPEVDPDGHRLKARNLAALWRAHRAAGSEYLVVSGTGGTAATTRHYLDAVLDCDPVVVRLDARPEILAERIRLRGQGSGVELPGDDLRGLPEADLERRIALANEEAGLLERDHVGDFWLDTSDRTVDELADAIMDLIKRRT